MPKSKQRLAINLRRLYVDCRYGQLHVHSAFPSSGGFDEQTTLIALHDAGETGRSLREFAGELGRDRSVYVPDLPGTGESDPSGRAVVLDEQVAALGDFLEQMRFRQVDLFGHGAGAAAAVALALAHPKQVRKVVLTDAGPDVASCLEGIKPCGELTGAGNAIALARAAREFLDT
jgi:pimeloyl-ACP methyl ester carboxylesterase